MKEKFRETHLAGLKLLRRLGIRGEGLKLQIRPDSVRGLFNLKQRKVGDRILTVPFSCSMSGLTLSRYAHRRASNECMRAGRRVGVEHPTTLTVSESDFSSSAALLLGLTKISNSDSSNPFQSPFGSYVDMLPTAPECSTAAESAFDSVEDDALMAYQLCVDTIASNLADVAGQSGFSDAATQLYENGGEDDVTAVMQWALSIAKSRTLWLPVDRGELHSKPALSTRRVAGPQQLFPFILPGIDFVNHSARPNTKINVSTTRREAELIALRDIPHGEEVTVRYITPPNQLGGLSGFAHPKWAWQLQYDFVPPELQAASSVDPSEDTSNAAE